MSILFGLRRRNGDIVHYHELQGIATMTERWAPDGTFLRSEEAIGMGVQLQHTFQRSHLESQPTSDPLGNLLTIDGRIDNADVLCRQLGLSPSETSDSSVALAAFHRWGDRCFARFVGDWAIVLWSASDRSLYLARDHAGTRTLYYEVRDGTVYWGTYLESFFGQQRHHSLNEQFVAKYLSSHSVVGSTPYEGISEVLPAYYVRFTDHPFQLVRHWDPMVDETSHRTDEREYDEEFRFLFEQAVRRRCPVGDPVVAHLSGGVDSSSIVCMSDHIRRKAGSDQLVPTLSFFDDSEPHWNEKPYFTAIEAQRQRTGIHVPVAITDRSLQPYLASEGGFLSVGGDASTVTYESRLADILAPTGCRVFLSGLGGDELLGGTLTCFPELTSYLASLRVHSLFRFAVRWCLPSRTPLFLLLRDTFEFSRKLYLPSASDKTSPFWIRPHLQKHLRDEEEVLQPSKRIGHPPKAIANALAWCAVMETLPNQSPGVLARYEYRFPYLDRDLVEFLLRVPPSQMTRPGRRRFMMRRALREIVPPVVLERPRKGYILRGPLALLRERQHEVTQLFGGDTSCLQQFVDLPRLRNALRDIYSGADMQHARGIQRAIDLQIWLRSRNGLNA